MTTKATLNRIFKLFFLSIFIIACETEDILPVLTLSVDSDNLSEADGVVVLTATINTNASTQFQIPLSTSGTATVDADYSLTSNQITINSGENSGSITINGLQDQELEELENITFSVNASQFITSLSVTEITISVTDDESTTDTDSDGVFDFEDDCPTEPGQVSNNGCPFQGFFNEVHYDPASGAAGDANGDGTRDANADEFIEIYHPGPGSIDLTGFTISDASQLRHTFPSGTILAPNSVLVLFGGGTPTGSFGGAIVQTASEGQINMNNSGDFVTMADTNGNPVVTFDVTPLSNNPNESYTRNPDLTGEFEQHAGVAEANGALYSPGTKLDGTNF